MSEPALQTDLEGDLPAPAGPPPRARNLLLRRLADVVSLPQSRINAFERAMTADLLTDILRDAAPMERQRVARRISSLAEVPASLARLLLRDEIAVAAPLLELCASLSDSDLLDCIHSTGIEHHKLIAARRGVGELVCEALVTLAETPVLEILLRNPLARLPPPAVDGLTALTREHPQLTPLLLRRPEVRPSHAYVLFWWSDRESRATILQRFAVSREVLQDAASDIFAIIAAEGWQDPLARKALQFIERRQRNRAAIDKSPFDGLEEAVAACQGGMTRELAEEISYLSGIKPMTGAKIFTDPGGEPLAILCKATGLPRAALRALWKGLRRPEVDGHGAPDARLENVLTTYDSIAVDRAQTVLRYWNWSLSSALTPSLIKAIREGDEDPEFSVPQRAAALALSRDFGAA